MDNRARTITIEEQRAMDLRRERNFVAPVRVRPVAMELPSTYRHEVAIDVTPNAVQHVHVTTSAVDRAKGHAISTSVLGVVLGVLVAIGLPALRDQPILTFAALLWFWTTFAAVWLASWVLAQLMSAEGVSFFEASQKWRVIRREQTERWNHYKRLESYGNDR